MLRTFQILVLVAVVVATAWWLVQDLDWATIRDTLGGAHPGYLLGMFGLLGVNHLARSLRLQVLVDAPVPTRDIVGISAVGFLAVQVLPLRLGELVRPQLLVRHGVPFGEGLGAIAVDRVLDVLMLLGLMMLVAFVVPLPEGAIEVGGIDVVSVGQRAAAIAVGVAGIGFVVMAAAGPRVEAWGRRVPLVGSGLGDLVHGVTESLRRLAREPTSALVAVGWSLVSWIATIGVVWLAQQAFDGIPDSVTVSLVLWTALVTAMSALPTPGFFGPFEAAGVAALALFGASGPPAKAFVLVLHVLVFAFAVALALAAMVWLPLSLDDLRPAPISPRPDSRSR